MLFSINELPQSWKKQLCSSRALKMPPEHTTNQHLLYYWCCTIITG